MQHSLPFSPACDSVDGGVWQVIGPIAVMDYVVGGVIARPEHKGRNDSSFAQYDMAVSACNVAFQQFFSRIIFRPLVRVPGPCHKSAGGGEDFQHFRNVFRCRFPYAQSAPENFSDFDKYVPVGRQPLDRAKVIGRKPCGGFVFVKVQCLTGKLAPETMHCEMERRVIPFDGLDELADLDCRVQFLADFAFQCLFRRLSGLHLTSREFPPVLEFPITPLCCEDLISAPDNSRHYFYLLHNDCSVIYSYRLCSAGVSKLHRIPRYPFSRRKVTNIP